MPMMNEKQTVESLNGMLAQEHACAIRYATHAAVIAGPYAEAVAARLREIASDEVMHAQKLRARIVALGGTPTMSVQTSDLKPALRLEEILDVNIAEERMAIGAYRKILEGIPRMDVILFETVEDILREEQEHLEELENLRPEGRGTDVPRAVSSADPRALDGVEEVRPVGEDVPGANGKSAGGSRQAVERKSRA